MNRIPESRLPSDIPREPGGAVFAEPWQARAFALAVLLSEGGVFSWKEWTAALGSRRCEADAEPTDEAYWRDWVAALEALLAKRGITP